MDTPYVHTAILPLSIGSTASLSDGCNAARTAGFGLAQRPTAQSAVRSCSTASSVGGQVHPSSGGYHCDGSRTALRRSSASQPTKVSPQYAHGHCFSSANPVWRSSVYWCAGPESRNSPLRPVMGRCRDPPDARCCAGALTIDAVHLQTDAYLRGRGRRRLH